MKVPLDRKLNMEDAKTTIRLNLRGKNTKQNIQLERKLKRRYNITDLMTAGLRTTNTALHAADLRGVRALQGVVDVVAEDEAWQHR